MAYRSKLRVNVKGDNVLSVEDIVERLSGHYDITYCGTHEIDNEGCIFIQNNNKMSSKVVEKLLEDLVPVVSMAPYTETSGRVVSKEGEVKKRGGVCGKRKSYTRKDTKSGDVTNNNITNNNNTTNNDNRVTNNSNNINLIFVIPIGQECLDHITPEFIQDLLSEHHDPDVVFKFGTKMCSVQENMNFKTDLKSGYIAVASSRTVRGRPTARTMVSTC